MSLATQFRLQGVRGFEVSGVGLCGAGNIAGCFTRLHGPKIEYS